MTAVRAAVGDSAGRSRAGAAGPWATEGIDVVRGASGGLLFGIPLLYTMEVWWTGSHTSPEQAVAVLLLTFAAVFLLNRTAGFRSTRDVRLADALVDSVEALALGIVLVTTVLVLTRVLTGDTSMREALGRISYQAMPFCIGIGVARHFLRQGRDEPDEGESTSDDDGLDATLADIGATLIGAVFIGLNIAPTDEVRMLSSALDPAWLLALVAASLAISYGIVFVAGFAKQDRRRAQTGVMQHPVTETVLCYLVALLAAWLMLLVFQRADAPAVVTISNVVVLGLPAAIGGAAGRLAI